MVNYLYDASGNDGWGIGLAGRISTGFNIIDGIIGLVLQPVQIVVKMLKCVVIKFFIIFSNVLSVENIGYVDLFGVFNN